MFCKEARKDKRQSELWKKLKPGKKRTMLQLKDVIFMQNITDVILLAREGTIIVNGKESRRKSLMVAF